MPDLKSAEAVESKSCTGLALLPGPHSWWPLLGRSCIAGRAWMALPRRGRASAAMEDWLGHSERPPQHSACSQQGLNLSNPDDSRIRSLTYRTLMKDAVQTIQSAETAQCRHKPAKTIPSAMAMHSSYW